MYEPFENTIDIAWAFASFFFVGGFYAIYYFNNQIFEYLVVGQLTLILLYCALDQQRSWGGS